MNSEQLMTESLCSMAEQTLILELNKIQSCTSSTAVLPWKGSWSSKEMMNGEFWRKYSSHFQALLPVSLQQQWFNSATFNILQKMLLQQSSRYTTRAPFEMRSLEVHELLSPPKSTRCHWSYHDSKAKSAKAMETYIWPWNLVQNSWSLKSKKWWWLW